MSIKDFDFLVFLNSLEKMMNAWYENSQAIFRQSTNLGSLRVAFC